MYIIDHQKLNSEDVDLNITSTILDAFKSYNTNDFKETEKLEAKITVSEGSINNLDHTMLAATILGSLLSSEGRINICVNIDKVLTYFEVDTAKLKKDKNIHEFVKKMHDTNKLSECNPEVPIDIEISDIKNKFSKESLIRILLKTDHCILSVKKNCMDSNMFNHLSKIVNFSFEKAIKNKKVTPAVDILPIRTKHVIRARKTMIEQIYEHKKETPLSIAIIDDGCEKKLTYEQLWNESTIIIKQIREHIKIEGLYPKIAIFIERSWKYLVSLIAVQRMGGTCVLIDLTNPDERLRNLLNESNPDAIISDGSVMDRAQSLTNYQVLDFDKKVITSSQLEIGNDDWIRTDNDVCFIAGTSGTTGRPKASCLSYSGMAATIDNIINTAELVRNSKGSWLSSPGYGMIEVDPIPVLCGGGTVCIPSTNVLKDIQRLSQWFIKSNITHTLVMTSIAEALWANGFYSGLQTMLIAGERCKKWPKTDYRVFNVYGSAEAAVVSIEDLSISKTRATLLPSVGRAVPGVNMYVVDNDGRELPACCIGELIITGETLSIGYIDNEATQKSFRPNEYDAISKFQYISGDRARMSLDGNVEIFGRSNALVKIRGHRVDLAEIEITALEISGVAKAAALCFNDNAGEVLELFIETTSKDVNIKEEVRKHLNKKLHPAAQPSRIKAIKLPLGTNGKVDYSVLASLNHSSVDQDKVQKVFYPATKIENALYEYWLTWTRCEEVTLESNFFEEGGDSLRAMRMLGDLTYKHGINIEMSTFLEKPIFLNLLHLANNSQAKNMPEFVRLPTDQQLRPFNLTEYQQALWIGRGPDFSYGDIGCQGYFEWEVKDLDRDRFSRAIVMLVERHPMLNATIDNKGYQKVGKVDAMGALDFIDMSELSTTEIEKKINNIRLRMVNEEIGVTEWPLFRFVVNRISTHVSRIHFNIDLLIADAWSIFQVIIPDLIDLYGKTELKLPAINTTFQDYVAYRNKIKQSSQYLSHREYWLRKIQQLPEAPTLPYLEQVKVNNLVKFERYEGVVEEENWKSIKKYGEQLKISPSAVVGLVFCEVLRCWSENKQFTLNLPISDRMSISDDIDLVVGDFTNPLLVPYEISTEDTLETRGKVLQEAIWEALDHRLFTGVEVLRELSRFKRSGLKPLMPVVFTSLLGHSGRHDISLLGREVFSMSQTPQVTLDVQVRETAGELHFKWDYVVGAIRPDVVEKMFNSFQYSLDQLGNCPEVWKSRLFEN